MRKLLAETGSEPTSELVVRQKRYRNRLIVLEEEQ